MNDETIYKSTEEASKIKIGISIPFNKLDVGLSVFVHFSEMREDSLRSLISKENSKDNKKFKLFKHTSREFYEIACISNNGITSFKKECDVVESSDQAKMFKIECKRKYPFNEVPEGKSFLVPIEEVTSENSIKVSCSIQSRKLGKKFVCIKHEDVQIGNIRGWFEIYNKPINPVHFFEPSSKAKGENEQ